MPPDRTTPAAPETPLRLLLARLGAEPILLPPPAPGRGAWRVGRAAGLLVGAWVRAPR